MISFRYLPYDRRNVIAGQRTVCKTGCCRGEKAPLQVEKLALQPGRMVPGTRFCQVRVEEIAAVTHRMAEALQRHIEVNGISHQVGIVSDDCRQRVMLQGDCLAGAAD
jgi:hypothetical protein